ncbi:hypothetical protein CC80DRAFT_546839 [Byssothecium circinans]|uniref:Killer toxin Kp4 domain-containing protein n=1 Tax=Byssothecium circinans TaxID=147558 RepID=A0A6A5U9I3_9PLEO|nr:hypothetical protein CC80DRAFT_546839 [Byssothecium circinans]
MSIFCMLVHLLTLFWSLSFAAVVPLGIVDIAPADSYPTALQACHGPLCPIPQPAPRAPPSLTSIPVMNCKGNHWCQGYKTDTMKVFKDMVDKLPDYKQFWDGEHIACLKKGTFPDLTPATICMFFEHTSGRTLDAALVKKSVQFFIIKDCKICGTIATEDDGLFENGALTVNYVLHP